MGGPDLGGPCPRPRCGQRGFGVMGLVLVLLLIALGYLGYLRLLTPRYETQRATTAIDASKAFACATNRQTIEREVQMWLVNHPGEQPSMAALAADGTGRATCPEGGIYSLDGLRVHCSKHD